VGAGEDLLEAAKREFTEETGIVPAGPFVALSPVRQKAGKVVHAWAFEGDCEVAKIVSNTYRVEWPPKSGKWVAFPEVDRAEFFDVESAARKVNAAQAGFVRELAEILARR
jgi:predicted NUDIX family NTP pyrophosphohydrolase